MGNQHSANGKPPSSPKSVHTVLQPYAITYSKQFRWGLGWQMEHTKQDTKIQSCSDTNCDTWNTVKMIINQLRKWYSTIVVYETQLRCQ